MPIPTGKEKEEGEGQTNPRLIMIEARKEGVMQEDISMIEGNELIPSEDSTEMVVAGVVPKKAMTSINDVRHVEMVECYNEESDTINVVSSGESLHNPTRPDPTTRDNKIVKESDTHQFSSNGPNPSSYGERRMPKSLSGPNSTELKDAKERGDKIAKKGSENNDSIEGKLAVLVGSCNVQPYHNESDVETKVNQEISGVDFASCITDPGGLPIAIEHAEAEVSADWSLPEIKPDMMFLLETKSDQNRLESLRLKLGFSGKLVVNSIGRSGGLCLFWTYEVQVSLLSYSTAHIDIRVDPIPKQWWRFTGFYGNLDSKQRAHSWTLLKRLGGMLVLPWLCLGDFNEVMEDSEKFGGATKDWRLMSKFREALDDCGLDDLGFTGPQFTWCNKREGNEMILERLDRCTSTPPWKLLFPIFRNQILISIKNVMVIGVTKGQKRITAEMLCFSGLFGDFKTKPNGHEILRIIYHWKYMEVYFLLQLTR
ncbi:hypothetical protein Dsin_017153 [Dipteronia sinensis]|uniref:Endonuclease/exonuclease/phosphatase domain-containing protein n=1 Tax=Dipteronia sinensis TaxID=43782 RepID=A0AAE0AFS4_9ROSI|nr:hypothetical protein Dsin_017153 [Dipteronia sinensis]